MMNGSKDVYYSLTPDTSIIRPRTHSQVTPGRRQRKISQVNRKFSHTSIPRKRRESRHAMQSAASALSRDQHLDAVKELETTKDQGGYFDKRISKLELFRRGSRLIQLFASLCLYSQQNEKAKAELTKHTVFTEYLKEENEDEQTFQNDLYFDLSYFKANRKMYVSSETKHVLSLPSNVRTEQQISKVKYWLSHIQSFSEYPRRMQQKLIQVGWYEGHAAKRVLIRQGHRPQAFYFLLSGSAVVTIMDKQTQISRTVHFLKRGDSFGELAILHDTVRQSTIITREFSELLVISKEDFVEIFMASRGVKTITDPDHLEFIRNINFLKDWPIELLSVNPKRCLFHFFRRGAVLVKDSNRSDWLYVVKSGSCRVLKKLKKVQSRLTEHQERVVGFERVSSRIARSSDNFNKLRLTISALSLFKPSNETGMIKSLSNQDDSSTQTCDNESHCDTKEDDVIAMVAKAQRLEEKKITDKKMQDVTDSHYESTKKGYTSTKSRKSSLALPSLNTREKHLSASNSWSKLRSVLKSKDNLQAKRRMSKTATSSTNEEETFPSNKLSFLDEEDVKKEERPSSEDDDETPIFVEIANLTKGDTFGVNFIFFEAQPSLSLVSNGVECIVISKKFFLSHCTEAMKRRLHLEEQPYPNEETLQRRLQDKINWESFKTQTLTNTIQKLPQSPRRKSTNP